MNSIILPRARHSRVTEALTAIKKGSLLWEYDDAEGAGILHVKNASDASLEIAGTRSLKSFFYKGELTPAITEFPATAKIGDTYLLPNGGTGALAYILPGALITKITDTTWFPIPGTLAASSVKYVNSKLGAQTALDALDNITKKLEHSDLFDPALPDWAVGDITNPVNDGLRINTTPATGIAYLGSDTIAIIASSKSSYINKMQLYHQLGSSLGEAMNAAAASEVEYAGLGRLVWRGSANTLLVFNGILGIPGTTNTQLVTTTGKQTATFPCYLGNDMIVFAATWDSSKIYIRNLTPGTDYGTLVVDVATCSHIGRIDNNRFVYLNGSDNCMYLKDLTIPGTGPGTKISTVAGNYPCYLGNDYLLYSNVADSSRLYLKKITDSLTGTRQNTSGAKYTKYIGKGAVIYSNSSNSNYLFKRQILTP